MDDKIISGLLIEDNEDDAYLIIRTLAKPGLPDFKFTFSRAGDLKTGFGMLAENTGVILLEDTVPDGMVTL